MRKVSTLYLSEETKDILKQIRSITQQQITQLLRKYGVSQVNWNVNYDLEQVQLDFIIEYTKQEDQSTHKVAVRVKPPMFAATRRTWDSKTGKYTKQEDQSTHKVAVRVKPPMFAATRRTWDSKTGKYTKQEMANWAQSMRLLFHWIKAKLEAVSFGLNSVEKEFLSDRRGFEREIILRKPVKTVTEAWELLKEEGY